MNAAGAYLWALREAKGMTREELAYKSGTNAVQVMRIEKGEIDTRSSLLASIIGNLRANADHVMDLILDVKATEEDGRKLAQHWLSSPIGVEAERQFIAEIDTFMTKEDLEEALRILQNLQSDEKRSWFKFGRFLKNDPEESR